MRLFSGMNKVAIHLQKSTKNLILASNKTLQLVVDDAKGRKMSRQSELVKEEFFKAKKLIGEEYLLGYFEKLEKAGKEEEQYVRKEESSKPSEMTESSINHSTSNQSFNDDLPDYSHESFASATSESESETSGSNTHSHTDSFGSPTSGSSNISPVSVVKHSISLPEINGMPKPEVIKKSVSVPNFQLNSATSFALQSNIVLFNSKMKSKSSSKSLRQQKMEEEKMKQKIGKILKFISKGFEKIIPFPLGAYFLVFFNCLSHVKFPSILAKKDVIGG